MSDLDIVWSRSTAPDIARQIIDAAKKIANRPENGQAQIKGRYQ
jgi:hypothetical protein